MANTSSAIKKIRQINRRTEVNRGNKSRMRTQVKKLQRAIESKDVKTAQELLVPTASALDKAVQKGVIKKNTASRLKSRLSSSVKRLAAAEASS